MEQQIKNGTYTIPEGFTAKIEDGKIVVEKKQSNDEKIRQEMVEFLDELWHLGKNTNFDRWCKADCADWIAYLEKQKEQKSTKYEEDSNDETKQSSPSLDITESVRTGRIEALKNLLSYLKYERKSTQEEIKLSFIPCIEKLLENIEQQPAEWKPLEESMEALLLAIEGKWDAIKPTGYMSRRLEDLYDGLVNTFSIDENYLNRLSETEYTEKDKDAIEPTPKQDYSGLTDFERAIHRGFLCAGVENVPVGIIKDTAQDCLAHIKPAEWVLPEDFEEAVYKVANFISHSDNQEELRKTSHRFAEQLLSLAKKELDKPAEWSEEDEFISEHELKVLKLVAEKDGTCLMGLYNKLKSLRSQPRWKPSEEQMDALKYALGEGGKFDKAALESLYEQLKKL